MNETSQPIDLLLSVSREGSGTLGSQIEQQLRGAIRKEALRPGAQLPSTRDLARQLGVSRRIAVDAYAQLAAEGYISLRQGARPRVSEATAVREPAQRVEPQREALPRFDFRPSLPDVSTFPRAAWLRSLRRSLVTMTEQDLVRTDPRGVEPLRVALADYLGRVRGVVAEPARVAVTCGYSQGLGLVCNALHEVGARRIGVEDPSNPEYHEIASRAGLEVVFIGVDESGIRIDALERADVDVVALTPAHQDPTGVVLTSERRTALVSWLRTRRAIAIEDDYDAEYRYDRAAVGAVQGLEPDRVVYAGSASKILAPALRLGWLVLPSSLVDPVAHQKLLADRATASIEQYALADFLTRGDLDRHLRRMRIRYRGRRDAMIEALANELPEARALGISAGLSVTVRLPPDDDERRIRDEAERRRISFSTMVGEYGPHADDAAPTLMLGYARMPEPTIRAGVKELAAVIRATRKRNPSSEAPHDERA
jgi:GntR family transcriptional regulator/MocR family aminotransferase